MISIGGVEIFILFLLSVLIGYHCGRRVSNEDGEEGTAGENVEMGIR